MTAIETEQFTEGRDGLRIPILDLEGELDNFAVLNFLRDIQSVNGMDISLSQGSGERFQRRSFHNKLMLGRTGVKPLVVIEGSFNPKSKSDIDYELRRNRERQEWGYWSSATVGYEEHSINVTPVGLDQPTTLMQVNYRISTGGNENRSETPSLRINGRHKEVSDFFPKPGDYTEANQQLGAVAYSDFLKKTMEEVVTILK